MKIHDKDERKRRVRDLEQQIQRLQTRLAHIKKAEITDETLRVVLQKE